MEMQRSVAEFWARLASIEKLEQLREGERLLLLDEMKGTLGGQWLSIEKRRTARMAVNFDMSAVAHLLKNRAPLGDEDALRKSLAVTPEMLELDEFFMGWAQLQGFTASAGGAEGARGKGVQDFLSGPLTALHEAAFLYIRSLLFGKTILVNPRSESVRWRLQEGELQEEQVEENLQEKDFVRLFCNPLIAELIDFIRSSRPVFPFRSCPVCSKIFFPVKNQLYCSQNCAYRATEGARKDRKRDYMRDYMAKRREEAKEKGKE